MENIGQKLKTQRTTLGLSIQQVANKTKVRFNVISDLEENHTENLDNPYVKAFVNTLQEFYSRVEGDINLLTSINSEPIQEKNTQIQRPVVIDLDDKKNTNYIYEHNNSTQTVRYKIKKSKALSNPKVYFRNSLNVTGKEIATYIALAMFLFVVIFFVFVYDENTFDFLHKPTRATIAKWNDNSNDSIPNIATKDDELFKYFEDMGDSIVLVAVCKDTAWVRLEMDGKKTEETVMLPNTKNRWTAMEQIIIATSKVGNIMFYKDDTLLPKLGSEGTMVKNITITRNGISNVTPLTTDDNPIPASQLPTNIRTINNKPNNNTSIVRKQAAIKRKKQNIPITIIDFSKPNINKSPILEQQQQQQQEKQE